MVYRFGLLHFLGGALAFGLFAGLAIGGAALIYRGLTNYKGNYQEKPPSDYSRYADNASRI